MKVGVDVGVDVATPPGGGGRPPSFPWHALSIDSRMPSPSVSALTAQSGLFGRAQR